MLFSQKEFEHNIDEIKLKKGLKLLLRGKVELLNKTENNTFYFIIHDKVNGEISVQIKSDKIISYNCFCSDKNYCEHLAAANFYLQQEELALINPQIVTKKTSKTKRLTNKISKSKVIVFEKYVNKIKDIIHPFLPPNKLKNNQTSEIQKKISSEKIGALAFNNEFYFQLAIICELSKLTNGNSFEEQNPLGILIKNAISEIELSLVKGLSVAEKDAFLVAANYSMRSQLNFRSAAFSFLASHASVLINDIRDFENLKALLKKRRLNKNRLNPIDRKLIAELQLNIMEAKLIGKTYSVKNYEDTIELPVALAELEFINRKNAKGFKLLEKYGAIIKTKNINKYLDFINEVLIFAKNRNNKKTELFCLIEKFVCGYYIDEKELARFFDLSVSDSRAQAANQLIIKIKNESVFFTFEKVALILLDQNKLDELIAEIKKEKNKFKLLNVIAIKKYPDFSNEFFSLYLKHFFNAVAEAKFPYFQQQLFDLAKTYLDLVPCEIREKIIETIKEKMIYEKHMVAYIAKLYPEAKNHIET